MLVEFKVGNYRSFRKEQALSLVASKDTKLRGNCVGKRKLRLLKAVGIYGPNASGKSNFIKALYVMRDIILASADYQPGKKLPVQPFLFDSKSKKKPSTFEVTFYHENVRYQYGFSATSKRIHDEWLLTYPKGRAQTWYERKLKRDDWKFGSFLKGEKERLKDKTRENVLFLSVGAQWNNKQLTTVYEWFKKKLRVMPADAIWAQVTAEMLLESNEDKKIKTILTEFIKSCLQDADLGIFGLNVEKSKVTEPKFLTELPEKSRDIFSKYFKQSPTIEVEMLHKNVKTGKEVFLPIQEESDGTRRFFELAGPWLEAIVTGMTVFIDELEASLHPLLTRELIKLIQGSHSKQGAQLIFTTHDTTLLDPELFRRDQIWFTEKDEHSSTRLYSMLDYKPRKGEAMQRGYLAGRYGAVPIIEAFKLNGK